MKLVSEVEVRGKGKRPRLYGHLLTYDDGTIVYYAKRKHREIFRGGCTSITDAITTGKAGWAIDEVTLLNMRAKRAAYIGVRVDNGDSYITPISTYFTPGSFQSIDYEGVGRGGARQRVVLLSNFVKKAGAVPLAEDAMS